MAVKRADSSQNCIEKIRHTKIKVGDPGTGRSVVLLNPGKLAVRRIKMDRCLMPTRSIAADSLVSIPKKVDIIIELKGKNVDHAARQIEAAWTFWIKYPGYEPNQPIGAWILCREYPRADLKINRFRENFRARGGVLIISTHNGEQRSFSDFEPGLR
jgi:hypothetical protein